MQVAKAPATVTLRDTDGKLLFRYLSSEEYGYVLDAIRAIENHRSPEPVEDEESAVA